MPQRQRVMPHGLIITEVGENEFKWEFYTWADELWQGEIKPSTEGDEEGWSITGLDSDEPILPMPLEDLAVRVDYEIAITQAQKPTLKQRRKAEADRFFGSA